MPKDNNKNIVFYAIALYNIEQALRTQFTLTKVLYDLHPFDLLNLSDSHKVAPDIPET